MRCHGNYQGSSDATFTHDNLDRVTQVERYDGTPTLQGRSTTAYDNLGRVYEQRTYSVASGTAGNYLTASTWHDELGRVYRTVAAGAHKAFTHSTYNGAGWVTGVYRGVGPAPRSLPTWSPRRPSTPMTTRGT